MQAFLQQFLMQISISQILNKNWSEMWVGVLNSRYQASILPMNTENAITPAQTGLEIIPLLHTNLFPDCYANSLWESLRLKQTFAPKVREIRYYKNYTRAARKTISYLKCGCKRGGWLLQWNILGVSPDELASPRSFRPASGGHFHAMHCTIPIKHKVRVP